MTRAFSAPQKFRILVNYGAQIIVGDALINVAQYLYGTQADGRRFQMLRRDLNCVVMCACGCDVWSPLRDIQFDHIDPHCYGGGTTISNGRPLTVACHRAKSRVEHAATARDDRIRRKLSVTTGLKEDDLPPAKSSRSSWPTVSRSLRHPTLRRRFDGRVERRMP